MPDQNSHIYETISRLASDMGFGDFGCARACRMDTDAQHYGKALAQGRFAGMTYLEKNLEKRFDPRLLVEGAKTVLCFLAPYGNPVIDIPTANQSPSVSAASGISFPMPLKIASYAWGRDYHKIIKDKLHILLKKIQETVPGTKGRVFVDSAPVLERAWAVRAGLGFIGKNNFLISRKCGIRNFIGIIITDLELPCSRTEEKNYCGNCTRCLTECPSGALCAPFTLDARKCVSYQTIESKLPAGREPVRIFRDGWYFGCDACMNACPWNRKNIPGWKEFHTHTDLLSRADGPWWEHLSEESFAERFRDSPLQRAGLEKIRDSVRSCLEQKGLYV